MGRTKACATLSVLIVLFEAIVSIVGIKLDNKVRHIVEATARVTTQIRTKGAIFVAFTPPLS